MTWTNIRTDPPRHGAVVIATDGKQVIAGQAKRFDKYPQLDQIVGANLQTGHACALYFDELTEWQLPPATWGAEEEEAHWEHIIDQKPEFDAVGRFIGISETPKVRCSRCLETNKNYEPPFCPHCGAPLTEEVADDA